MAKRTQTKVAAPEGIPAFLRRNSDNTVKVTKTSKKAAKVAAPLPVAAAVKEPTLLERIEDEGFRTYVTAEIKSGRIQGKWLADGSTLALLRTQYDGGKKATASPAEKAVKAVKVKAVHAEDCMFIASFDTANPRKVGSANHAKYEKFKAYMFDHPNATVGQIVSTTGYYRNDLLWDVKQGRIKLTAALETPAAKKEAKGLPPIKKAKAKKKVEAK
jgi:hypothetical protein